MNLAEDLRRQLEAVVANFIGDPAQPPLLRILVGSEALLDAPAGMNGAHYAQWLVRYSLVRRKPAVFLTIVEVCDPGQALVELQALASELKADSGKWMTDIGDGLWVPEGWPFVDRQPVREVLTEMAAGGGPPALSIEGPFGHGKETMGEYVGFLANETQSFRALVLKLQVDPVPGLLTSIANRLWMVLEQPADTDTTHTEPERQAAILARQLALAAAASPVPTWLVANIVNQEGLEEEGVIAFLDELLRLVQGTPAIAQKLRMLVLCDQLSLLGLKNLPPQEARHTLGQVSDVEVRQWFEAATPGKPADLYQVATDRVMLRLESANPQPERRLEMLSRGCAIARKTLLAVADT